jgi:nucleosome assembly protein 1-like 1
MKLQGEYDELESQYNEEMMALGNKYRNLYAPLFSKRSDIITGRVDPALAPKAADAAAPAVVSAAAPAPPGAAVDASSAVVVAPPPLPSASATTPESIAEAAKKVVGIPGFWLQAMKNNEDISMLITEADEEALKHLEDIRVEYLDGMKGFRLVFVFAANDFFSQTELSKAYTIDNFLTGDTTLRDIDG